MSRNYAGVMHDYAEEMVKLTDEEFGRLMRGLLLYSKTGQEPTLEGREELLWPRVKAQEDRLQKSYDDLSSQRSEAGRKGAESRWRKGTCIDEATNNAEESDFVANDGNAMANDGNAMANDGNIKTESDSNHNKPPSAKGRQARAHEDFTPPSLDEVADYVRERRSLVDPQAFYNYYAARGWMCGAVRMEDWQAALRSWECRDKAKHKPKDTGYCKPGEVPDQADIERMEHILANMCKEDDAANEAAVS